MQKNKDSLLSDNKTTSRQIQWVISMLYIMAYKWVEKFEGKYTKDEDCQFDWYPKNLYEQTLLDTNIVKYV